MICWITLAVLLKRKKIILIYTNGMNICESLKFIGKRMLLGQEN